MLSDNLYGYCASTTVPAMQRSTKARDEGPRTLSVDGNLPRTLRQTHSLHADYISRLAQQYPLPSEPLEGSFYSGRQSPTPNLTARDRNGALKTQPRKPITTLREAGIWVDSIVYGTALAVVRLQDSIDADDWKLESLDHGSETESSSVRAHLSVFGRRASQRENVPHVLCLTFLPWELRATDLGKLTQPTRFSDLRFSAPGAITEPLSRTEQLWCYIFDQCMSSGARWFVVNNVDHWCFGVFGKGWRAAYISPPLKHDNRQPTLLQCCVLWLKSSIDCESAENGFGLPIRKIERLTAVPEDGESSAEEDDDASSVATETDDQSQSMRSQALITQWDTSPPKGPEDNKAPLTPMRRSRSQHKHFEPYPVATPRKPLAQVRLLPADSHVERATRLGIPHDKRPGHPNALFRHHIMGARPTSPSRLQRSNTAPDLKSASQLLFPDIVHQDLENPVTPEAPNREAAQHLLPNASSSSLSDESLSQYGEMEYVRAPGAPSPSTPGFRQTGFLRAWQSFSTFSHADSSSPSFVL